MIRIPQLSPILSEALHRNPVLTTDVRKVRTDSPSEEKHLRRLLWYLLGGTRGGPSRAEILKALRERPLNASQLAGVVRLDYKTIEHHLRVLEENGLVTSSEKGAYGAVLFLTPTIEQAWPL